MKIVEEAVLVKHKAQMVEAPSLPEVLDSNENVLPAVRSRVMLEKLNREAVSQSWCDNTEIPFRLLSENLAVVLAWDLPETISLIDNQALKNWGTTFEELLAVSIANLAQLETRGWSTVDRKLWSPIAHDDYTASRILLPGYLEQTKLDGQLVVMNPRRTTLLVTSADDADGLNMMFETALGAESIAGAISYEPLISSGNHWKALKLKKDHKAFQSWSQLAVAQEKLLA